MYFLPFAKKNILKFDQDSKACWSFCFELKVLNEFFSKKFVKEVIAGASAQVHFFRFLEKK